MIPETQAIPLYLPLFLWAIGGAMLVWAILSAMLRFWKSRKNKRANIQAKIKTQHVPLHKEFNRFPKSKSTDLRSQNDFLEMGLTGDEAVAIERKRIAHELHDDTVQRMATVRLRLEGFSYRLDKPELVDELNELGEEMNQIMKSLRFIIYGLPQPQFKEKSFSFLMKDFLVARLNRAGSKTVEFTLENENQEFFLPSVVKKELYNLVQESVQNSLKHSSGFRLKINVSWSSILEIEISDNGQGYLPQAGMPLGLGLSSMQERAESIGANLHIMPSSYGVLVKITMLNLYSK